MASKKTTTTGSCSFQSVRPIRDDLRTLNIQLSFEDALKLNMAIDEGVRRLNGLNRAGKEGRNSGLTIIVHTDIKRFTVKSPDKLRS
jgi:hypothetical protein